MKKNLIIIFFLLFSAVGSADQAFPQVYRFKDKDGVLHFTDTPTDQKFTRPYQEPGRVGYQIAYHVENPAMEASSNRLEYIMNAVISLQSGKKVGSGFIINPQGFAVTNYHVIADASDMKATGKNQKAFDVHVLQTDREKDLALIKISGQGHSFLPLATEPEALAGKDVYVIGSPLGFSHTLSKGIVSAVRKINIPNAKTITLIQTDALTNLGNSGGPLVTFDGLVLGVITLKVMQVQGISFAVSSHDIVSSLNLLPPK